MVGQRESGDTTGTGMSVTQDETVTCVSGLYNATTKRG
jgi:hypothetical protein